MKDIEVIDLFQVTFRFSPSLHPLHLKLQKPMIGTSEVSKPASGVLLNIEIRSDN